MTGFRWMQAISSSFWVASAGFGWFQVISGGSRLFLVLVSTIAPGVNHESSTDII